MRRVGIRQLKEHTSEIVRAVRDEGESVEITYHGRPIARLVPASEEVQSESPEEWLRRWDELGARISATWPKSISAVDAVREQRRDL